MQRFFVTHGLMAVFWFVFIVEIFVSESLSPDIQTLVTMGGMIPSLAKDQNMVFVLGACFCTDLFCTSSWTVLPCFLLDVFRNAGGAFWVLCTFLISGYGAAHFSIYFSDPQTVLIGASGGVMGVMGALLLCAAPTQRAFAKRTHPK